MMANNQSGLELAARGMDLLTAILNSPRRRVVANIARWLGREGVDEEELSLCLQQSAGLVYANDNCETFYTTVTAQLPITQIAKDFVVQGTAGSLGGQMATHPRLRWLTSTVAGLFQFHGEDYIHATILAFIIQANQKSGKPLSKTDAKYDTSGVTMKRVLKKLVDSVWFYVVNSGTAKLGIANVLPLPKALDDVCKHGHYLTPFDLGSFLARIRAASQGGGEIVIESTYLIKDLVWWLWYHFPGNLTVVVGGRILEEKPEESTDAAAPSRIELRVGKSCPPGGCDPSVNRSPSSENTVKAHVAVAGKARDLFGATTQNSGSPALSDRGAAVRIDLYDVFPRRRDGETSVASESLQIRIRSTAVSIVSWLLDLPVFGTAEGTPDLAFAIQSKPGDEEGSGQTWRASRVMDFVARSPLILNMEWEVQEKNVAVVFKGPSMERAGVIPNEDHLSGGSVEHRRYSTTTDFEVVLRHYPILKDLASGVKKICKCMPCRQEKSKLRPAGSAIFDKGCLQNQVIMQVLQLVAHAIADCFGCEDASALSPDAEDLGALALLSGVTRGRVRWNDWFAAASRVFLGCPDLLEAQGPGGVDTNPRLAVQYGGLATLAPWLDMSADLRLVKPFSMQRLRGRIGVLRGDGVPGTGEVLIQSVEGDFAVIDSRETEVIESQVDEVQGTAGGVTPECTAPADPHTRLETDMILVPEARNHYELWLRARTKKYSRLIDPSSAIRALPRLLENQHLCSHTVDETSSARRDPMAGVVRASTFDQVLGTWGAGCSTSETMAQATNTFYSLSPLCDSHLRLNVTAALTLNHARIVTSEKACLACRSKEKDILVEAMASLRWLSGSSKNAAFAVPVSDDILERGYHAGVLMIEEGKDKD
jgi:hypothetical protein